MSYRFRSFIIYASKFIIQNSSFKVIMRRAVITGFGLVTPLGCQVEQVWKSVCEGRSGVRLISDETLTGFRSKIGGECLDFTTDGYMESHEAKRIDRFVQYAIVAAMDAVKLSGLDFPKEDRSRCASIIGSGVGGLAEIEIQHQKLIDKGGARVSPFTIPKIMPNAAAGQVSIHYKLTGPSYAVSTACASGANAIHDALGLIRRGVVDVVVTGGTEAALTKLGIAGFCAMRALSERNDDPAGASRPFDKDRDGFVLSEGAGILVLESEEHAKSRGAAILGEILGAGVTSDGTHIAQPDEEGHEAARAMTLALDDAMIAPDRVDYINAHGTSTTLGDLAETAAIKKAFGESAKKIPISSTKSQMGHLLGGSAGVAAILTLLTLRDGVIPPTINLENPDPACDLDYTPQVAREKKCSVAITNSFGFGGHNACLVIGR